MTDKEILQFMQRTFENDVCLGNVVVGVYEMVIDLLPAATPEMKRDAQAQLQTFVEHQEYLKEVLRGFQQRLDELGI